MNENQSSQEKEFSRLMDNFSRFAETRDKLITEIENIIDRVKSAGMDTLKKACDSPEAKTPQGIIYDLHKKVAEIDLSNERLSFIVRRLNELF
jgi:predicted RND superfamily exporter protein